MLRYISASLKGNLFSGETMHSNCKPQRSRSSCQKFLKKSGFKRGIFLIFLSLRPTENSVGKIYCNLSEAFKFFLCFQHCWQICHVFTSLSLCWYLCEAQGLMTQHKWHQFRWRDHPQHPLLKNQVPNPAIFSRNAPVFFISSPTACKLAAIDVKNIYIYKISV